ncbi:MAG: hypothetical protein F4032_00440 [Gemmatimonadetes bacterium]|nr:hypothetical protein [Gemmatimonadota bacterium]
MHRVTTFHRILLLALAALLAIPHAVMAQSGDATLSALALTTGGGTSLTLSPTFSANTMAYRVFVQNDTTSIVVTATKNDDGATVAIAGDTDTTTPGTATLALSEGLNTVTITVTAEDNTTATYTIKVARAADAPTADPMAAFTANLTVDLNGNLLGYNKTNGTGALVPRSFEILGNTYTLNRLEYDPVDKKLPLGFEGFEGLGLLSVIIALSGSGVVVHFGDQVQDWRDSLPDQFDLDWTFGEVVLIKLFTNPPDQVTGVQVIPKHGQLEVTWERPIGARGYKVEWKSGGETFADAETDGRQAILEDDEDTSYTITGVTNGPEYMVRVIATNDTGDSTPSDIVKGTPSTGLTARLVEKNPVDGSGGRLHYVFDLKLSTAISKSFKDMRDYVFTVTDGEIVKAQRIHKKRRRLPGTTKFATFSNHWRMEVRPETDDGEVIVAMTANQACNLDGALCDPDGRLLLNAPSLTLNASYPTLSIRDATANEDDGWLRFTVTASRPSQRYYIVYDFETISGGTAIEGTDYLARPKYSDWMDKREVRQRPFVRIIDDTVNDNGETVKVKISNARLMDGNGNTLRTLTITRAEATGTIANSDPMPQAYMARFGRTVAVRVVEQVKKRIAAPRDPGFEGRVAGWHLRRSLERDIAQGFLNRLGGMAAGGHRASGGNLDIAKLLRMTVGGRGDVLTGSAFTLNREMRRGSVLSFWSNGSHSDFSGREGTLSLNGAVRSLLFGFDYAKGPLVTGLTLAHSRGHGRYADIDNGQLASSVTGLYPWLGYRATDRITLWGVTGYGKGALRLTPGAGGVLETGLSMAMAAAGLRGELTSVGGFGLAFKTDALGMAMANADVAGPAGNLAATRALVTRLRAGLEASRSYALGGGMSLQPRLEVGLRHDGGDAETGAGVDLAGSLIALNPLSGLSADVRVRTLLVHQAKGFQDKGVAISFSYNPQPSTPLGFVAQVAPSWGGQAISGAEALWNRETMERFGASGRHAPEGRFKADLGYGLPVGRRFVGTPKIEFRTSEYGRDYQAGYGLELLNRERLHFELDVDVQRRELLNGADHGVLARGTLRW